ncbi:MAG: prolipoprotein diacylglyceryl transferase [Patescibacteria group bacterium]
MLFSLFGLPVYAYGASLALAFLLAIALASREARRRGINPEIVVDIALALCLGGVIGARLLFVLLDLGYYLDHPWQILNIRAGGMSFLGAAFAGFGAAWWHVTRKGYEPWALADLCVPYAALGYAIVRLGCFLRGCCYGTPSGVPWALACKEGDPFTLRHPAQLYASLGSFLIFLILLRFKGHRRFTGFLLFLYMGLYAVMRGIIEAFREDPVIFYQIRTTQLACIALLALAAAVILRRERRRLRAPRPEVMTESGEKVGRGA